MFHCIAYTHGVRIGKYQNFDKFKLMGLDFWYNLYVALSTDEYQN